MHPPPSSLKIEDVYMLLGEKDVIIYQLGEAFNRVSAEKVELERELAELKNGRLERTNQHVDLLPGPRSIEGNLDRRGNVVSGESNQSPNRVNAMEQIKQPI